MGLSNLVTQTINSSHLAVVLLSFSGIPAIIFSSCGSSSPSFINPTLSNVISSVSRTMLGATALMYGLFFSRNEFISKNCEALQSTPMSLRHGPLGWLLLVDQVCREVGRSSLNGFWSQHARGVHSHKRFGQVRGYLPCIFFRKPRHPCSISS